MTAKHRVFQFLEGQILPDQGLIAVALGDAYALGTLSSTVHVTWALAAGGRLGVGNDPRYNNTRCFETFPFPDASPDQQTRIRDLAEQLDAQRKARQAADPALTLTGIYNVLAKLRAGEPLTPKDKAIHQSGLVGVLATLHAELDAAVLAAYGWSDLAAPLAAAPASAQRQAAEETLLERLVALNAERRREEAAGRIRWLRPDFQNPQATLVAVDPEKGAKTASTAAGIATPAAQEKSPWPPTLPEQMALLARLLAAGPFTEAALAARIAGKGPWKKRLPDLLQTLVALGRARQEGETWVAV
jgi:hypothetical protein